jgi:hypothetical protein
VLKTQICVTRPQCANTGYSQLLSTVRMVSKLDSYENNQQDAPYRLIYYSKSALHIPGDIFAYHQEHLTVFTVFGSVYPSCCRLPVVFWVHILL